MAAGLASKGGLQGEMVETLAGICVADWQNGLWAERFARAKSAAASRQVGRALSAGPAVLRQPGGPAEDWFCGKTAVFLWKTGVSLGKSHCSAVLINRCHSSSSANGSRWSVDAADPSRFTSGIGAPAAQLPSPPPSQPPALHHSSPRRRRRRKKLKPRISPPLRWQQAGKRQPTRSLRHPHVQRRRNLRPSGRGGSQIFTQSPSFTILAAPISVGQSCQIQFFVFVQTRRV
jgi:hypothetical protein